jgi:integrase
MMIVTMERPKKARARHENERRALERREPEAGLAESVVNAIALWAGGTTDPESSRYRDLIRIKSTAIRDFFRGTAKLPPDVTPMDVRAWRTALEGRGLAQATIYARISYLSSFYAWLMADPALAGQIGTNPARHARPRAPRAYQTESTKAPSDEQLQRLVEVVRTHAETGSVRARRDYALFLFFVFSGMRRAEVLRLRGQDLELRDEGIVVTCRVKGGNYAGRLVANPAVRAALVDYLAASGRMGVLGKGRPLWRRHDRDEEAERPLSEWAFVLRMKGYAAEAGIERFHLHQTRHTFARIVAETSGSYLETQDALGHKNPATTRAYVQRIAVKRDKFGDEIARRIKL